VAEFVGVDDRSDSADAVVFDVDGGQQRPGGIDSVVDVVQRLTGRIQTDMFEAATARRDALICDCTTLDQARDAAQTGVARVPWALVGTSGEQDLASSGLTVRCLQLGDGSMPDTDHDADALAYIARAY